ncbi:MAG TPA: hypothetical protein VGC77_11375 [Rhodopseudomonas sp.]|uniref:hypothetical protein n=1 Tax=Rhodopseudomonas sp. TaxID=1078 RepID=UPI002ED80079
MVFESSEAAPNSLVGNYDALRLPIRISIGRHRPLTTRMWESLFREMEDAALQTDLRLYEEALTLSSPNLRGDTDVFQSIIRQTDRFVITSIDRGSIEITAAILLAAGWIFRKFIEPGWEKSRSKQALDDAIAGIIDSSGRTLKEQIDNRIVHKLQRLKISRVLFHSPSIDEGRRLSANLSSSTELIYDKPKQIAQHPKKEVPR